MLRDFLSNTIINDDMQKIFASISSCGNPERLRNSSFYVSGASGMLASYFTYFLIFLNEEHNYGIKIFAGIRNSEKARDKFGAYLNRDYFSLIAGDVNNSVELNERVDYVIHAASPASPQYYGKIPVEVILPNVVGTYNLLEYAKTFSVKGFLFFSSGSVYGTVNQIASEEVAGTLDFTSQGNAYAESKRCGEALCRAYYSEYGVPAKSIRIFHSYGPTMDIKGDKRVFAEFVNNVINNEDIVIRSDGSAKRGFCYISDAISAMFIVLLDGKSGESYNLGNMHEWLSMRELAFIMAGLYPEKKLQVIFEERKDEGYLLRPEIEEYPVSMDKIMSLGWSPSVSVEEGFRRVIESHKRRQ